MCLFLSPFDLISPMCVCVTAGTYCGQFVKGRNCYLFSWIQHKDRIFHILSTHERLQLSATLENMSMASGRHRDSSMVAGWLAASLWSGVSQRAGLYSLYSAELSPYSWVSGGALCLHILHHSSSKVRICLQIIWPISLISDLSWLQWLIHNFW